MFAAILGMIFSVKKIAQNYGEVWTYSKDLRYRGDVILGNRS